VAGGRAQRRAILRFTAITLSCGPRPASTIPARFAFHSDDIEYVFGTLDTRPGWTVRPEDRKLSDQMMSYWTNFAKTGNPNGEGLPNWPNTIRTTR
jgi:carboxylesterase type B